MKDKILQKKKVINIALFILLMSIAGMTKAQNISFADESVKALCVANWDTNGDGELSYDEASEVTDLGTVFKSKTTITSFNELQYFTGLTFIGDEAFWDCFALTSIVIPNTVTSIGNKAFDFCDSMTSIVIPSSVTSIGNMAFYYCKDLTSIIVWAENPPTLGSGAFDRVNKFIPLYVPCTFSQAYQNAEGWNEFANRLEMCPGEITVTANVDECGTVAGGGSYEGGETCTVTAIPNEGYFFAYWSENGEEISNEDSYSFTVAGDKTLVANFVSDGTIDFADNNVKAICLANWDTNGDGELSYAEADAVTDLGEVFKNKSNITTFNELQYFTGLTSIGTNAFYYCTNLTSVVIPNFVTIIGQFAFNNCRNLTTITIPNSVTSIYGYSFKNCNSLTTITIPNSVTSLGYDAFRDCSSLTTITIPNSVTSIGSGAFSGCISLGQIVVDSGNTVYDSRNNCNAIIRTSANEVFAGCKNTVIPNTVTSIGEEAFEDCSSLTWITIPNTVTSIGKSAFSGCNGLTLIAIPSSVTSIGNDVFKSCSGLGQIIVDSGNPVYDSRNNSNAIIKTSTNELIAGCKNTVIPNSVTSIGSLAFYGCSSLTSINIPNSVTSIANQAFSRCENLTSISIPNSVTSIGMSAFYSCTGLTSVSIGNSVTSIEEQAFYYCNSLTSVLTWSETPPVLGNYVFGYVDKSIPLYVACGSYGAYRNATGWNDFNNCLELCPGVITVTANASEYGIVSGGGSYEGGETCTVTATPNIGCIFAYWSENGDGVSSDETYSFIVAGNRTLVANFVSNGVIAFADDNVKARCLTNWDTNGDGELSYAEANAVTSLGSVFKYKTDITSFNELQYFTGLTSIGNEAFYGCSGLTSVVIPNSVTSIEQYAFSGCSVLDSITIPNSVTSLGGHAFSYCTGLTTVAISNTLVTIGEDAFYKCESLTSVNIPSSVTSIGNSAFSMCSSLEQIVVEAGNPSYDSRNNCNAIIRTSTNVLIAGCKNSVIPNTVISIGNNAFSGCSGLTSIDISNSVTSIGQYAFYYCTGLTSVSIGSSVTSIGNYAFSVCSSIGQIVVASGNGVYDSREDCNAIIKTSTNELILGCKNTVIPNSVTSIGASAFNHCSDLTSITIPNSVISIGTYAFSYCTGLTSLVIPNSVTTIKDHAFSNCSGLTSLVIGSSVTSIQTYAFSTCSGLTSVIIWAETPPVLGTYAISSISKTTPMYVPCGFSEGYRNASGWDEFTNYLEMCPGVITVLANVDEYGTVTGGGSYDGGETCTVTATPSEGCFFVCWLENGRRVSTEETYSFTVAGDRTLVANFVMDDVIVFADANVKALCVTNWDTNEDGELSYAEANAVLDLGTVFSYKNNITAFDELQYFTGLTSIGNDAFSGCTSLSSIVIPNSVVSIRDYAFNRCLSLTSITIPDFVTSIGSAAFYKCTGLTSVTIPSLVSSIGTSVFRECSSLEQIVVDAGNTVYDSRDNCNAIIKTSTNYLIVGCRNTIIPNTVTSISYVAFYTCPGLISISIPSSVTTIGSSAFANCPDLTEVILYGTTPPSIEGSVFSGSTCPIYVPYESIEAYKTATNWVNYESRIQGWLQKGNPGYGNSDGKWALVASPLIGNTAPTAIGGMINDTATHYDLYRFNQSSVLEWENYKFFNLDEAPFYLVNGQGYLYASHEDVNLFFKGVFNENESEEISLTYDTNATSPGWNLVGNPFPCYAYINRDYYVIDEDGVAITPVMMSASTPIPPCTSVMVKADNEGETVVFTRVVP